jgi:hypothetical protein
MRTASVWTGRWTGVVTAFITYLLRCPRRPSELVTMHESQRFEQIGQWNTWELMLAIV